jgi:hypothetical protein
MKLETNNEARAQETTEIQYCVKLEYQRYMDVQVCAATDNEAPVQREPQKKAKVALRVTELKTGGVAEEQTSVTKNELYGPLIKKTNRPAQPQTKPEETVLIS